MSVIFLTDLSEDTVDAVIITETSTAEEVEVAIQKAKEDNEDYQWDDLINSLPEDCKVYDRWSNEEIYY